MLIPRNVIFGFSASLIVLGTGVASGQTYPNKPIRIVAGATGGGADSNARLIAPGLTTNLGQQVIIDNRPTSASISEELVAKAPPDGYTLLVAGSTMWITPLLRKAPYDPVRNFLPITLTGMSPNILVVNPSVPARSVKELIALAKAKPGELNYASTGMGGTAHLATELFKAMADVDILHVPYTGSGAAATAVVRGEVQLLIINAAAVAPHIKSGRVTAVAVTSLKPSVLFPGLPTVAASLPGYESVTSYGVFAPANTSAMLIARLNHEIVRVLNSAETKERFAGFGIETVVSSPEELSATMKSEMVRMDKVVKDAGIKAD